MRDFTLADCYGHAGLSPDPAHIALRMDAFEAIAVSLTNAQVLDAVRFYFGLPVADAEWFSAPIIQVDRVFSTIANKREVAIISMALIARRISEEGGQFAALAFLVAHALGRRKPAVYPQFAEAVEVAAKDLMTSQQRLRDAKPSCTKPPNIDLADAGENFVSDNDFETLNVVLAGLNADNHEMHEYLTQVSVAIGSMQSEVAKLREETDMLWWLLGGESYLIREPYLAMEEGRAAFLIGADLAALSRTCLGPRSGEFLMNKALREGRTVAPSTVKVAALPKLFTLDQLKDVAPVDPIDHLRDLCSLNNAIARANDVRSLTSWHQMYAEDGSLAEEATFVPGELALQSYRETLLLNSLSR